MFFQDTMSACRGNNKERAVSKRVLGRAMEKSFNLVADDIMKNSLFLVLIGVSVLSRAGKLDGHAFFQSHTFILNM